TYTLGLPLLLFMSSPQKIDCDSKLGTIQFTNTFNNPYDVYLNGKKVLRLQGKKTSIKYPNNPTDSLHVYVKQVSGYLIEPTVFDTYVKIEPCNPVVFMLK